MLMAKSKLYARSGGVMNLELLMFVVDSANAARHGKDVVHQDKINCPQDSSFPQAPQNKQDEDSSTKHTAKETTQSKSYTIALRNNKQRSEMKPTKFKSNAKRDRNNAQFLRFVVKVTCLSLIGWMPQYVTTFLSLSHMYVSGTVLFIVHWSTYLKAVLCPIMYLVCCSEYRQVVRYSMRRIKKSIHNEPQPRKVPKTAGFPVAMPDVIISFR
ncbi:hypothetical protein QZH41_004788 [Actinostola sp. cb2023]|nr:hypothetical protein QZH41_004788 [Actinostola sp. cb2023]